MDSFLIEGGTPLKGTISVSGSKNAALPIIMAAIAVDDDVTFTNVPDLKDVKTTIKLLNILGREAVFENGTVKVKNGEMGIEAPYDLVKTMRASVIISGCSKRYSTALPKSVTKR